MRMTAARPLGCIAVCVTPTLSGEDSARRIVVRVSANGSATQLRIRPESEKGDKMIIEIHDVPTTAQLCCGSVRDGVMRAAAVGSVSGTAAQSLRPANRASV